MTSPLERYLNLRAELARIRWAHAGFESAEEDALLETMDDVWSAMSEAELAELKRRPPRPQLTRPLARRLPGQIARIDTDVFAWQGIAPRRLDEVA